MAFNDTEIEMKFAVGVEEFENIRSALAATGTRESESQQCDHYFVPRHRSYLEQQFPFEWLSVRERGDGALLNYKHFHPEGAEHHSHCDEIEVSTADAAKTIRLLDALGFTRVVIVRKHRVVYTVAGDYEVSMDTVDELGQFVEIEAIRDQGGVAKTRKAIADFALSLGLGAETADPRGYPYQLLRKKGCV